MKHLTASGIVDGTRRALRRSSPPQQRPTTNLTLPRHTPQSLRLRRQTMEPTRFRPFTSFCSPPPTFRCLQPLLVTTRCDARPACLGCPAPFRLSRERRNPKRDMAVDDVTRQTLQRSSPPQRQRIMIRTISRMPQSLPPRRRRIMETARAGLQHSSPRPPPQSQSSTAPIRYDTPPSCLDLPSWLACASA
jgi:hypothetical protein